jgi:hypothetical protein
MEAESFVGGSALAGNLAQHSQDFPPALERE